ncbi:MAG TPA: Abi-alpha family protein [Jatrophihabitans sp.]|jgi:hypothetical protein|nr:Abi-alpha family protein [Jatrophihabitans sp.]
MPDNHVPGSGDATGHAPRRPSPGSAGRSGPATAVARRPSPSIVRAGPGLARVVAVSAWNLMSWSVGATVAGANYVARRAVDGESAPVILHDAASELRNFAWRALGLPAEMISSTTSAERSAARGASAQDLQRRGTELLRRSNDVHVVEDTHPAFARILTEITPDEARILRFVYLEGPQPAIDIRTFRPLGIGSELVAAGMSMIAEHAGLRNLDRIDPYLTNLGRLGLIDFSKEQVSNPTRYQVIEAQPKVIAALKRAGRAPKLIQRSIRLTSFGAEFVRTCLPLNGRVVAQREGPAGPAGAVTT